MITLVEGCSARWFESTQQWECNQEYPCDVCECTAERCDCDSNRETAEEIADNY